MHREKLVIKLRVDEGVCGTCELDADYKRVEAAEDEEKETN